MPDPVLLCDPTDRVRAVNAAADRLFAGSPVRDGADLLSRFEPAIDAPGPDEAVTVRPVGRPNRWFELRWLPIDRTLDRSLAATNDSRLKGGRIFVLRDVTRTRDERDERHMFLSILSHELRTPITTIYAGSRVLARREAAKRGSREIAADISAEAARLYDVVEDLLVLTRAEQDVLELSDEPVLIQRILEAAVRVARGRAPDITIIPSGVSEPPAVRGDAVYVEQVVRNLLTAAARFGGPATVDIAHEEAGVSVRIIDRGPAPSDEEIAATFSLAEAPMSTRRANAGISLFVCHRLIAAMDGRTWIKRAGDVGAEIGFWLPRYEDQD